MPPSTQALYFHLGLNADDDGVAEAYNVMKLIGSTEDDLRILITKEYVQVLNEDLVVYILDWADHNSVRPDRKIDSKYKDLLVQIIPNAPLVIAAPRADRPDQDPAERSQQKGRKQAKEKWDRNGTAMGPHRLGEDRIGEDRKEEKTLAQLFDEYVGPIPAELQGERTKFLNHFTAKNDGGVKEYWQMIKTKYGVFSVKGRWTTWINNVKTNFGRGTYQSRTDAQIRADDQKHRKAEEAAAAARAKAAEEVANRTPEEQQRIDAELAAMKANLFEKKSLDK